MLENTIYLTALYDKKFLFLIDSSKKRCFPIVFGVLSVVSALLFRRSVAAIHDFGCAIHDFAGSIRHFDYSIRLFGSSFRRSDFYPSPWLFFPSLRRFYPSL
ncbi:hypothetical protein [Lysinibacillus agricola]|uniref:hypothetical protein n=1 Tax=Lysinibacillus agricola TaxID=2590012 RepID=UPI003C1EC6E3